MCSSLERFYDKVARFCLVILTAGYFLTGAASSQIISEGLGELDLWAVNFLENDEQALPATSWAASDGETLLALTRTARTRRLSPVEHVLMRRLVLSPADTPEGEGNGALLSERVRLMFQIGEASAAAQLLPTLQTAPEGFNTEEVAVDLQLAIGQTDAACLSGAGAGKTGMFWSKLRAVCFALEDNFEEAELAMELAGASSGDDGWFSRAIFAASGALKTKPEARFDDGLSLALSAKAGLEPSVRTIANSRLDLAAAIARQDTFNPAMRVQAAGVAAEAGLLTRAEHRALYKALVESDGFSPRTQLEVALKVTLSDGADPLAKARALRAALRTARGNAARYSAVARLLLPDVKSIQPSQQTERMMMDFASASLAAGAPDEAARWMSSASDADGALFEHSWLIGVLAMTGAEQGDADQMADVARVLIAQGKTREQKQAVTRLFVLWNAVGIDLPHDARNMLAGPALKAPTVQKLPAFLTTSISAAGRQQAGAEAVLRILRVTNGDAYKLAANDVSALIGALTALGQSDAARMLALEATGYWRTSL